MKTKAGVWIDHKRAVVVVLTNAHEEIKLIRSHVEKHRSRSGDSPRKGSYEAQLVPADDSQQRSFTGHLNVYYDQVIDAIGNPEAILILGPGEAKGELKKRIEKKHTKCLSAIKTVGKMTHRQIAAAVRTFYSMQSDTHAECNRSTSCQSTGPTSLDALLPGLRMM